LETKITALTTENLSLKDRSLSGERLVIAVQQQSEIERLKRDISTLQSNFSAAASIWNNQIDQLRLKYPSEKINLNHEINTLLQKTNVKTYNVNGVETIEVRSEKTV
jgi:hypothetical protein